MTALRPLRRLALPLLCGLAALALIAAPGLAATSVLGHDGTVYSVTAGTYGALFPQGTNLDPSDPVLALNVAQPNGSNDRLLVPATAGPEPDGSPSLVYEDTSNTVYLLWTSKININPVLYLTSYNGQSWSDPVEITGNPFAMKGATALAVTRETFTTTGSDGTVTTHQRTILHLAWKEENAGTGLYDAYYTPVVLEDGAYTGSNAVYRLDDLTASDAPADNPLTGALSQEITIRNGAVDGEVMIGFVNSVTQRFVTVAVDALPHDLVSLADGARAHIIVSGVKDSPSDIKSLAADARAHIIATGLRLHPGTVQLIANDVASYLEANADELGSSAGLTSLADGARAHIIVTGARYSGSDGLRNIIALSQTLVVKADPENANESGYVALRVVNDQALPPLAYGTPNFYISPAGTSTLFAWTSGNQILYRESLDESSWSDLQTLHLDPQLSPEQAAQLLAARISDR